MPKASNMWTWRWNVMFVYQSFQSSHANSRCILQETIKCLLRAYTRTAEWYLRTQPDLAITLYQLLGEFFAGRSTEQRDFWIYEDKSIQAIVMSLHGCSFYRFENHEIVKNDCNIALSTKATAITPIKIEKNRKKINQNAPFFCWLGWREQVWSWVS